jgi:hypothetical protein
VLKCGATLFNLSKKKRKTRRTKLRIERSRDRPNENAERAVITTTGLYSDLPFTVRAFDAATSRLVDLSPGSVAAAGEIPPAPLSTSRKHHNDREESDVNAPSSLRN